MSSASLRPVFVVAAKRTPFGTFLGSLQNVTATDLAAHATKAALASGNVPAEAVDAVIVGNVAQVSELTSLFFTSTLCQYVIVALNAPCREKPHTAVM